VDFGSEEASLCTTRGCRLVSLVYGYAHFHSVTYQRKAGKATSQGFTNSMLSARAPACRIPPPWSPHANPSWLPPTTRPKGWQQDLGLQAKPCALKAERIADAVSPQSSPAPQVDSGDDRLVRSLKNWLIKSVLVASRDTGWAFPDCVQMITFALAPRPCRLFRDCPIRLPSSP